MRVPVPGQPEPRIHPLYKGRIMFTSLESPARLLSPLCVTDIRVLVTYVDEVSHEWVDGESDYLASEYVPLEEYSSVVDRIEERLLELVPDRCRHTVSICHLTRDGRELYVKPATDA